MMTALGPWLSAVLSARAEGRERGAPALLEHRCLPLMKTPALDEAHHSRETEASSWRGDWPGFQAPAVGTWSVRPQGGTPVPVPPVFLPQTQAGSSPALHSPSAHCRRCGPHPSQGMQRQALLTPGRTGTRQHSFLTRTVLAPVGGQPAGHCTPSCAHTAGDLPCPLPPQPQLSAVPRGPHSHALSDQGPSRGPGSLGRTLGRSA
ncbi:PREDICTED: uncharacterized protein LOC106147068 [Chinchilla lanigera]|uniref:uncharacterized protein LOC106147068 n=1 Tax=Chinchilla lanigera TaxID=34839 RepID=UPI0006986C83|nr:PREDICTED: uncharacterized protein LOC106147068 [Chinchilla lanigera]